MARVDHYEFGGSSSTAAKSGDLLHRAQVRSSAETLRKWVRRAETEEGLRPGLTSDERERLKTPERENPANSVAIRQRARPLNHYHPRTAHRHRLAGAA